MKPKPTASKKTAAAAPSQVNERKRAGAQAGGSLRTSAFYGKWRAAMTAIEQEVRGNGGVYPQNDGQLDLTELARRAGSVMNSLYPARHADFKMDVDDFIDQMNLLAPAKNPVEKEPGPTWEELYKMTVTNYQAEMLTWRSDRARREAAETRIEELEATLVRHLATIDALTQQVTELTQGRVVPIGAKKGGS
jgi:hypothetical protein